VFTFLWTLKFFYLGHVKNLLYNIIQYKFHFAQWDMVIGLGVGVEVRRWDWAKWGRTAVVVTQCFDVGNDFVAYSLPQKIMFNFSGVFCRNSITFD